MDSFLKSYDFEKIKDLLAKNVEQFILNKIRKSKLTDVFNENLLSEKILRNELKIFASKSIN